MSDIRDIMEKMDQRTLNVYIAVDTSGSTNTDVHHIIKRELELLSSRVQDSAKKNKLGEVDVRYRMLQYGGFNKTIHWFTNDFVSSTGIQGYTPEGNTNLSEAVEEIASSVSSIEKGEKPYPSIILFLGDGGYSGEASSLERAIERLKDVKIDHPCIVAFCSFGLEVHQDVKLLISKDKYNNLLVLKDLSDDSITQLLSQVKLSILKPTSVFSDIEIL